MILGGYQTIDFNGLTMTAGQTVNVTDARLAKKIRNIDKPAYVTGLKSGAMVVSGYCSSTNTGSVDGQVLTLISNLGTVEISTNDSVISVKFTAAA